MAKLRRTYDSPTKIYFVTTNTHYRRKLFLDDRYAKIVVRTLLCIQKSKWIDLIVYVVMPDGIHVMFEVIGNKNVSQIVHSIKSYSAQIILEPNRRRDASVMVGRGSQKSPNIPHTRIDEASPATDIMGIRGRDPALCGDLPRRGLKHVWQKSFYDRVVDNEEYFNHLINYIHFNPVKDGLVNKPEDWSWSSYREYQNKGLA